MSRMHSSSCLDAAWVRYPKAGPTFRTRSTTWPSRVWRPGHRFRPRDAAPPAGGRASEANAAGDDDRRAAADFPASIHERRELAAFQFDRGAAEQVQSRLGVGGADGRRADGRGGTGVGDVQATAGVGTKGTPSRDSEPVCDVAVDLPVVSAGAAGMARKEVVERDDAIERGLGKQGVEREHAPGADAEVDIATPIELRPERRALRRTGGRAPLGYD